MVPNKFPVVCGAIQASCMRTHNWRFPVHVSIKDFIGILTVNACPPVNPHYWYNMDLIYKLKIMKTAMHHTRQKSFKNNIYQALLLIFLTVRNGEGL